MSKLAIDLTYQPVGGALAQIQETIKHVEYYRFEKILFYCTPDNLHLFNGINEKKIVILPVKFSNKSIFIRTIWAQLILPFSLVYNHVDILFCPGNISPIINLRKKAQWIGTVGPFESGFISSFPFKEKLILLATKYLIIFSAYTSDLVIYESNYTKNLFVKNFRQREKKAKVLHIGNDDFFKPINDFKSINAIKFKDKDFILLVSHLYPYKNIELLLDSYNHLKLEQKNFYVIIAGSILDKKYYNELKLKAKKYGISQFIIFLGRVEKSELRELYSKCKLFVFTSPFENFAYTLVEAMSCSAPIIATNSTAMPETCGDAALYFSPDSEKELSECINTYLTDEKLRINQKKKSILMSSTYEVYSVVNKKTSQLLRRL